MKKNIFLTALFLTSTLMAAAPEQYNPVLQPAPKTVYSYLSFLPKNSSKPIEFLYTPTMDYPTFTQLNNDKFLNLTNSEVLSVKEQFLGELKLLKGESYDPVTVKQQEILQSSSQGTSDSSVLPGFMNVASQAGVDYDSKDGQKYLYAINRLSALYLAEQAISQEKLTAAQKDLDQNNAVIKSLLSMTEKLTAENKALKDQLQRYQYPQ